MITLHVDETVPHCDVNDYQRDELRWMNEKDDKETEDSHLVGSGNSDTVALKPKPSAAPASLQNLSVVPSTLLVEMEPATTATKTARTRPDDSTPLPKALLQNEQANDRKTFAQKPFVRMTTPLPSQTVQTNEEDEEDESIVLSRKENAWRLVKDILKLHESLEKNGTIPPPVSPLIKTHSIALVAKEDDMVSHLASLTNCIATVTQTPTFGHTQHAY